MRTHIELKLRCDSKEAFDAWMEAQGLVVHGQDLEGNPTTSYVPGTQVVEIGPIMQVPPVYGPGGIGDIVTPPVVDEAFHADVRFFSPNMYEKEAAARQGKPEPILEPDFYEITTDGIAQTEVVVVDGKPVEVAKDAIDSVAIAADIADATAVVAETKDGLKVAPGYYDAKTGIAIVKPATPRHEWC